MDSTTNDEGREAALGAADGDHVIFRLEGVGKTFQMGDVSVQALRGVTLEFHAGDLLVLLGPSGSGKSTLLNVLGGLDVPTSGKVWFRGRDLSTLNARELTNYRRKSLGFVFQFYNLIPNLTARENVMVATEISHSPMTPDEALALVDLSDRADHFPSQLSGGEQQRVAIARALAKRPDVLLCDEPTGALDYQSGKQILAMLADLKDKLGKTVLLITHNTAISRMADFIVRLRSGEVIEAGPNPSPVPPAEIAW